MGDGMKVLVIMFTKILQRILKLFGRGSSLPGTIARKLSPNILSKFKLPNITICVTGTTGKTSISGILCQIYEQAGYTVGNNSKGSNLEDGVISLLLENSTVTGKVKTDVLVIELDERYVKRVFKHMQPDYFIVNNISRDQMARNGHFDIVWNDIHENITDSIHLILNADDPLIYRMALDHQGKVSYYGLRRTKYSRDKANGALDLSYCPVCHHKLIFDYFHYGNIGGYHCPNHDFSRPNVVYESVLNDDGSFRIDGQVIQTENNALYQIYNLSAGYVTALVSGAVDREKIAYALNHLKLKTKRLDTFQIGKVEATLLLSKNDTPISYNQSIDYICNQKGKKTVFLGFNTISIMYNIKDISWMYDVNFELLQDESIEKIVCMGSFAYDIGVRLKYANIDMEKVSYFEDSTPMLSIIEENTIGHAYLVFPFDMEHQFQALMKEKVK